MRGGTGGRWRGEVRAEKDATCEGGAAIKYGCTREVKGDGGVGSVELERYVMFPSASHISSFVLFTAHTRSRCLTASVLACTTACRAL